jgi:hypothetical protein
LRIFQRGQASATEQRADSRRGNNRPSAGVVEEVSLCLAKGKIDPKGNGVG